jgi:hypothetical protein
MMLAQLALLVGACHAATPDICAATQGLLCQGKTLNSTVEHSHPPCCAFCKATAGCTAWSWDGASSQCHALKDCGGASASLGETYSGSSRKLPRAQWPPAGPPVLPLPFRDASLALGERVRWLVANLSNSEKEGLLGTRTSSIPRLAIKEYMYYVECNSGAYANGHYPDAVRGKTCSTVNLTAFPQSPGMAATADAGRAAPMPHPAVLYTGIRETPVHGSARQRGVTARPAPRRRSTGR